MAKPPPPPSNSSNVENKPTPKKITASKSKGTVPSTTDVLDNLERNQTGTSKPLNFRVPEDFHREFKLYATAQGVSMVELLYEGFELVKRHKGQG